MSYLSDELERQMRSQNITGLQLAERTGISPSQIYNWLKSTQVSISEKQMTVIQAALTNDSHAHARLVLAHLLDEKFGFSSDMVSVELLDGGIMSDRPKTRSKG